MPLLDQNTPQQSLAMANSAVLMALLDRLIAKGLLDHADVQGLIKDAKGLVGYRSKTNESFRALQVLDALWNRFYPPLK
jgi:hypothetical protein